MGRKREKVRMGDRKTKKGKQRIGTRVGGK